MAILAAHHSGGASVLANSLCWHFGERLPAFFTETGLRMRPFNPPVVSNTGLPDTPQSGLQEAFGGGHETRSAMEVEEVKFLFPEAVKIFTCHFQQKCVQSRFGENFSPKTIFFYFSGGGCKCGFPFFCGFFFDMAKFVLLLFFGVLLRFFFAFVSSDFSIFTGNFFRQ